MTLKKTLRSQIVTATKLKRTASKNVLKVVLGEIETQESRNGKELSMDESYKVVRKTLQGVEEMLQYKPNDPQFEEEKFCLNELLPKQLDSVGIAFALAGDMNPLMLAKSDGQAIGIAMKSLKQQNASVDGNLVKEVVTKMRNKNA